MRRKNNTETTKRELSEIALKNNLRISTPYGYYPEDTDKVLLKYEELVNTLQAETVRLEKELIKTQQEKKAIDDEFRRMKFEMSLMEVPDTSMEEDFSMMSRITNINDSVGNMPESRPEIVESVKEIDIVKEGNIPKDDEIMFDHLISKPTAETKKVDIFNNKGELEIL